MSQLPQLLYYYQLEKSTVDVESLSESHKKFIKNNKLILKSQQKFRSEKHNVFTEEVNKIEKKYITKFNPNWLQIPDHPYRILIIGGSGSGKQSITYLIKQ